MKRQVGVALLYRCKNRFIVIQGHSNQGYSKSTYGNIKVGRYDVQFCRRLVGASVHYFQILPKTSSNDTKYNAKYNTRSIATRASSYVFV